MNDRTVIITGANAGLGLECARSILERDDSWHVVLAVRDPRRGEAAVAELGAAQRCTVMRCDLGSLASVGGFIEAFATAGLPPLQAVVCNAGLQVVDGTQRTADGFEMTFGVNHLGHFALIRGLLEHLEAPAPHRRREQRYPRPGEVHRHAEAGVHLGRGPGAPGDSR
jgi:NAD(P)-dependent dehydrogenase (short-subunit alcohol dehydrogenase family)